MWSCAYRSLRFVRRTFVFTWRVLVAPTALPRQRARSCPESRLVSYPFSFRCAKIARVFATGDPSSRVPDGPVVSPSLSNMLTMSPSALQGQRSRSVAGPPKVVGELLKGTGPTVVQKRGAVTEQPSGGGSCAPAAAAMVLAKDMATGRKSSSGGGPVPQSPRASRASGIPIRPKPVPPSTFRKTAVATTTTDDRKQQQQPPKCRRPTSVDRVKVLQWWSVSRERGH